MTKWRFKTIDGKFCNGKKQVYVCSYAVKILHNDINANHVSSTYVIIYLQMNHWFISIVHVHVISTCVATKILYVLPDNVSNINCPSQPCATLSQYLLENGSLPVVSDVEYYFLPGEHHINIVIDIVNALKFSLIGNGLPPAKLVCWPQSYVRVHFSYNVTIKNLVFSHCHGNNTLVSQLGLDTAAGLFLYECSHCKAEELWFDGYGLAGINLFLNSSLNYINIDMTIAIASIQMCSPKLLLAFFDTEHDQNHDSVSLNNIFISGYNEVCYEYNEAMEIVLYQGHYGMNVELSNSQLINMDQIVLSIQVTFANTSSSILINNCTFTNIIPGLGMLLQSEVIHGEISTTFVTIKFYNCTFDNNSARTILQMEFVSNHDLCMFPSNFTIENCDFRNNSHATLLKFVNDDNDCKTNIFFNENTNITKNDAYDIAIFVYMSVYMNGVIILENSVANIIMMFDVCDVTFAKACKFVSNTCYCAIYLRSYEIPYMRVMEYTNITFINNIIHYQIILYRTFQNNDYSAFPHCIFQYMASRNYKHYNVTEIIELYAISFNGNKFQKQISTYDAKMNKVYDLMTHCQWLPTAVFNGSNPEYINQKIVQVDSHQWAHHKRICYCPHGGHYNCTLDLVGPVYPGQVLQVDLCMPQAKISYVITVATHAITLPSSACNLANQDEFINSIGNNSKTFNFTIISEVHEVCELFLTSLQFIRTAFYVQLLPCPVGFTLQNGKCDCDPFLPPDIDTCYIDLSAITRPANTWITAHTLTNNTTNYLISHCPMDYCLPYSTNLNLLYPDLQCQFNRTGMLCSQCQHSLSMVFASSRCMKCTNVHILITIIVIVAGIVLVVLLYVLNLTVTKGSINGIILYANIVSINDSVFLVNDNVFKPLRVFISLTNLNLGIETCFYDGMDSYAKMWLQLFFPTYLIIIAVSMIIASRYSSRILRLTYSRSLPVLATLFLLSYTGVLRVVLTVLFSYSTITEYPSGDKEIVWSIDASVPLFGLRFTILFITCLVLFLILIPFNITLLFTRYLTQFWIVIYFKPLLDVFPSSFKHKYYFWSAIHIILRNVFLSMFAFPIKLRLFLTTVILVIFSAFYGYIRPNKNKLVNIQELLLLTNLTIMHVASILNSKNIFSVIINIMIGFGFLQFCIIIICHFFLYSFHCNVASKEHMMKLWRRKKSKYFSYESDITLLNISDHTYSYVEYQD